MEIPDTQYAWNGDAALAYQILGGGSIDRQWRAVRERHDLVVRCQIAPVPRSRDQDDG